MKTLFLTNEYPPHIYGGAGVHVEYLSKELAKLMELEVRCFGDQKNRTGSLQVTGFPLDKSRFNCPAHLLPGLGAAARCVDFTARDIDADLVHCHTWYTHLGGILAKLNYGIPLVITVHSLEPLRPWKREQIGGGYDFSVWVEKTALEMADAVVAVSKGTREDLLRLYPLQEEKIHVIYNGIDLEEYHKVESQNALRRLGVNPLMPYVLFVGRITRQKGIIHLVNAIKHLDPGFQVVLCAGAPDTPEIAMEMKAAVSQAQSMRSDVLWIEEMLDARSKIELYSNAAAFVCPSIYEPFGIINLEAMACGVPVVAARVGGIKEVVVDGETGFLVPLQQQEESPFEPLEPAKFSKDLADRVNLLMRDPALRKTMGTAGRARAEEIFSWQSIAKQTEALYQSLLSPK